MSHPGTDFSIVSEDWHQIQDIDFYRKDYRKIGGRNGWQFDEAMVRSMVTAILLCGDEETACQLVAVPFKVYTRWKAIGERLHEHVFEERGVELNDEQEGYLFLYREISNALGLANMKSAIILHEVKAGNDNFTPLQARVAFEFLAKRNPKQWERKSGVNVIESRDPDAPLPSLPGGGGREQKVDDMDTVRADRDAEIAKRRRRPGTLGDLENG